LPTGVTSNSLNRREKDSLLSMYGLEELSESEDEDAPENPMSPEQIAMLLDRQIAMTRELDDELTSPPATAKKAAPKTSAASS